ncbi:MAG TPA: BTAD domain-containing putative transcriptional regulator [Nakamurella sp.]
MQHLAIGARVQLCGPFAVELGGRAVGPDRLSRQARVLFGFLVLHRPQPVPRDTLVDALWGASPPPSAGAALTVVVSKLRAAVGSAVVQGRGQLSASLPEPAVVDVEQALAALHTAESAIATGDWRQAWFASLTAHFVTRRTLLPDAGQPWVDDWRRRLADAGVRAWECYVDACLHLGGAELPAAERAARELVATAPLRETGHLLLMRSLAARGNVGEALAAYERVRVLLRDELGTLPDVAIQDCHRKLLG